LAKGFRHVDELQWFFRIVQFCRQPASWAMPEKWHRMAQDGTLLEGRQSRIRCNSIGARESATSKSTSICIDGPSVDPATFRRHRVAHFGAPAPCRLPSQKNGERRIARLLRFRTCGQLTQSANYTQISHFVNPCNHLNERCFNRTCYAARRNLRA
jgi:hypothetical protein